MTLDQLQARRQRLAEEFQKAMDQRERLRQAHDDAGAAVERIRGAIVLCDEFIATAQPVQQTNGLDAAAATEGP